MAWGGIDFLQTGERLIFDALFADSSDAVLTSGATLRLYELQSDGTLKTFEFAAGANQYTFQAGAITTATDSMTHRQGSNNTVNTGIHTYVLQTLTGFTAGNTYYAVAEHASGSPKRHVRKFQYGGGILADIRSIMGTAVSSINDWADAILKRDWTAVTGEASYSALQALRALRNGPRPGSGGDAGKIVVFKEDGTTKAFALTPTTDNAAEPITGLTPE